ncbi:MAG: DUF1573 domain-containing protein [Bacteroidia bacterium]|nr:DUF1573 domain-containing protein [Bacteroidia bacterium]
MKNAIRLTIIFTLVCVLVSCRDKAAEKRIAELESRLSQIEGNKTSTTATPTPSPTVDATPVADEKPEGPLPVLEFERVDHDFGTIKEGQKVTYTYKFKNTGQAPLIIQNAQPSCGCTAPDWSKEPIPVGGTGFVKAEFDTNGKTNIQNKTITVTSNTWPKTTTLRFKAMVTPKADGANGPVQ